jgi:hypothetical protein
MARRCLLLIIALSLVVLRRVASLAGADDDKRQRENCADPAAYEEC